MKIIGIQIDSSEAILVVLEKDGDEVKMSQESTKFRLDKHDDSNQVKQFRDQVNAAFDSIKADRIGIRVRNAKAKGQRTPSPVSFKLEGIIQLYEKREIEFIWPQTISAFLKDKVIAMKPKNKYQQDAFNLAYYLLNQ